MTLIARSALVTIFIAPALCFTARADPLQTPPAWRVACPQSGANFGYSVASAGDVNGDGYADIVVGARFYDEGEADEGKVFLYLGGPSGISTTPAWTAQGNQAGARFGISVASAGDVNRDGYDDVVVGSS